MKKDETAMNESRQFLLSKLSPGMTVNTILRHVSRSGMSREISLLIGDYDITYQVARLLEMKIGNREGIKIGGCGMDMGFELVYRLSRKLYSEGFQCVGERCPANDHSNGDMNRKPHLHKDGGYAIRQRWI